METKVTEHYFKYETNKFFRGNAHSIAIGAFGQKKDAVGPKSYLDVYNVVPSKHLDSRVKYNTTTKVDWSQTTKAEVEAGGILKFFGLGAKTAVKGSYEKAKSAKLELINFQITEQPLTRMLNNDAGNARKYLADEGNDGRIVSEVWVVAEAELAEQFRTAGSISVATNGGGNSVEVTASGGKHGTQAIVLENGVTFAYKMYKVKDWNKGKTQIEQLEDDYYGLT